MFNELISVLIKSEGRSSSRSILRAPWWVWGIWSTPRRVTALRKVSVAKDCFRNNCGVCQIVWCGSPPRTNWESHTHSHLWLKWKMEGPVTKDFLRQSGKGTQSVSKVSMQLLCYQMPSFYSMKKMISWNTS